MSDLRNVSSNPHIRAKDTTSRIMLTVVIALLLPAFFGIYNFGFRALVLILISIATCVLTEYIYEKLMKKPITIGDFSAVVTGLLLALNLPVSVPFWIPVVGGVFAILVVKMLFGGLGQNFMNPALGARCFLLIAFAADMTNFTVGAYSGATPLALIKNEGLSSVNVRDMLIGNTAGTIGETSVIAILIGAIIMILLGVIDLKIPASYIITFAVFMFLFGAQQFDINYLADICRLSPTHFRRLFHSIIGTSPLDFVNNTRITKACNLLRSTEYSILEISEMVGFRSVSSFNRHFMDVMQITPRAYRNETLQVKENQEKLSILEYKGWMYPEK